MLAALREAGYAVRALVRSSDQQLPNCEIVVGDLNEPGRLERDLIGCRYLVHCAAQYSFAPRDRAAIARVNVAGTAGLFDAAHIAGVELAVLTSSSAAVGPARNGRPADERDYPEHHPRAPGRANYHESKLLQERAAFASRLPTIAILPTAPVGPGDRKPTPTGAMILDFARGRMIARPPKSGGLNLVDVEDVARAHVAALERGRRGERYIVGGENLSFDDIWELLAKATGRPAPTAYAPVPLMYAAGWIDEARCRLTGATPFVPLEGVRMSREQMFVDSTKAQRELGITPHSVRAAVARAVAWFRERGDV